MLFLLTFIPFIPFIRVCDKNRKTNQKGKKEKLKKKEKHTYTQSKYWKKYKHVINSVVYCTLGFLLIEMQHIAFVSYMVKKIEEEYPRIDNN